MTTYKVIAWDDNKVYHTTQSLKDAKKVCRKLGHTGEDNTFLKGYPPVAYVSNNDGVVYNPRFKKEIK